MHNNRFVAATAALFFAYGTSAGVAAEFIGASAPQGHGSVASYAVIDDDGTPAEIGIALSAGALNGLPPERNDFSRCFDLDGNGSIEATSECDGDYELDLPFPAEVTGRDDIPFVFAMVNWNPAGHEPGPWQVPHFDIHFYQIPLEAVDSIEIGKCGIFIDCAAYERAVKPVPAKYVHPEHASVQAAVGRMGDHLIDTVTPEFGNPPQPFTHTWIFGAYDGSVIFHEVMSTLSFMTLGSDTCAPIKQPQAWAKAGWYPTSYCFRYASDGGLKVFMADFVKREAG